MVVILIKHTSDVIFLAMTFTKWSLDLDLLVQQLWL